MKKRQHEGRTYDVTEKVFASCDAPMFAQILNENGTKKILAGLLPAQITRRGYPASVALGVPRGKAWARFLATSWGAPRSGIKRQTANAYFAYGEMIEVLFAR